MIAAFALIALLHGTASSFTVSPLLVQHGLLFRSEHATAGGIGGGVGLQLEYGAYWITQLDLLLLSGFGNTGAVRLATGVQWPHAYAPAGFVTFNAVFGHRVEFVVGDGGVRAPYDWIVGLRAAPLRFAGAVGTISALEPGVGVGLSGGYALELTVLQTALRF